MMYVVLKFHCVRLYLHALQRKLKLFLDEYCDVDDYTETYEAKPVHP